MGSNPAPAGACLEASPTDDGPLSAPGLRAATDAYRAQLRRFDPALVPPGDCADLVGMLAEVEKAAAAAKASAAARAAAIHAHRQAGYADPADWLAAASGTSTRGAKAALRTLEDLERCPDTRRALASGELSLVQAGEIVATEKERPGSEADMLALARDGGLATLREEGRRRRAEGMGAEELRRRQLAARELRSWVDELGLVNIHAKLLPEVGQAVLNRLQTIAVRRRRAAKRDAKATAKSVPGPQATEPFHAHLADAFGALTAGTGSAALNDGGHADVGSRPKGTRVDVCVVIDINAYRRGHALPGEPCHILGGGPIPVEVARQLADDAFLKAVLHDGVAIHTVAHFGRTRPAALQTALDLGAPPTFPGVACIEPGCERRYGLEWDHIDPVANNGPTSYANLAPRCWAHHQAKTEADRRAGLLDGRRRHEPKPEHTDATDAGEERAPP